MLLDFDGYWESDELLYWAAPASGRALYESVAHQDKVWLCPEGAPPEWLSFRTGGAARLTGLWVPVQLRGIPDPGQSQWPPKTAADLAEWLGRSTTTKLLDTIRSSFSGKAGKKRGGGIPSVASIMLSWPDLNGKVEPRVAIETKLSPDVSKYLKQGNASFAARLFGGSTESLKRFSIANASPSYIHGRNLPEGYRTLKNERIVVVGAGTIGGFLSAQLCALGAGYGPKGELHIVDMDVLKPENIGRHVLGLDSVGQAKVIALTNMLSGQFPYLTITPHAEKVWKCIELLKSATLIINATGSISVGIGLEDLRSRFDKREPTIVHSWIEGHGLAATVFLSSGLPGDACFRCLVQLNGDEYSLRCEIAKTQSMTEPVFQGCHNSYHPYVVTASMTAAIQATNMVCDWKNERVGRTLKYNVLRPEHAENRPDTTPQPDKKCPVCSPSA